MKPLILHPASPSTSQPIRCQHRWPADQSGAGIGVLVAGRGFPRESDQSPSAPPDPAQSPPTAAQAPPKTTPHLVRPWLPGAPSPASGRRGRGLSERPKKEKKGKLGDSYVTGRGFITFSFAIDNIAKCMKETAPPGQECEGKVSSSRAGFAWCSGRAPTPSGGRGVWIRARAPKGLAKLERCGRGPELRHLRGGVDMAY